MEDKCYHSPLAREMYDRVRDLPIIDFHNHLPMAELAADRSFDDLTQLWIASDPYKHRAMRILGVPERLITGDASPKEKFDAWSHVLPRLAGGPLYEWSRMELETVFGIREDLTPDTAEGIWQETGRLLGQKDYSARGILSRFSVSYSAPCVGFADDLTPFAGAETEHPSLRADQLLSDPAGLVALLEGEAGKIADGEELFSALVSHLKKLHALGCRLADLSLDGGWTYRPGEGQDEAVLAALLKGEQQDAVALQGALLRLFARALTELDWVLQLHMGALRSTSERLRRVAGPAGGFAAFGHVNLPDLILLLQELEEKESLPAVILYAMDPSDYPALAILSGSFVREGEPNLVQLGPAWWWSDHRTGIRAYFDAVSYYGVLSASCGMTTDSRSLLSFCRHDYFRRLLCNYLAERAERGELPDNEEQLCDLAAAISGGNGKKLLERRGIQL